jgi:hypothetical protein
MLINYLIKHLNNRTINQLLLAGWQTEQFLDSFTICFDDNLGARTSNDDGARGWTSEPMEAWQQKKQKLQESSKSKGKKTRRQEEIDND